MGNGWHVLKWMAPENEVQNAKEPGVPSIHFHVHKSLPFTVLSSYRLWVCNLQGIAELVFRVSCGSREDREYLILANQQT